MVLLSLSISAVTDGCTLVEAEGPSSTCFFIWCKCTNCNELFPSPLHVDPQNIEEVHGRNSANTVAKCKMCGRAVSILLLERKRPFSISEESPECTAASFDFRGCEPDGKGWEPRDGWTAVAGNAKFDVDFSKETEWYDCNEAGEPISVTDLKHKFQRA